MPYTQLTEGQYVPRKLIVPTLQNPENIQPIYIVNRGRTPYILPSGVISVTTSLTQLYSSTVPANVELHAILVIPTSNAQANGVQFYINYGTNSIGSPQSLSGIIVPLTFGFDEGDYPVLSQGQNVSLYASATTSGAGLQVVFIGVFI